MKAKFLAAILTTGAILGAAPAQAETPPTDSVGVETLFIAPQSAPAVSSGVVAAVQTPVAGETLSDAELADQRGGEAIVVTNQTLTAITSGNVLNGDYMAGAVTLSDNALSSFNGVGNLLINTGAQVSLQTGMNLTINVTDN